MVQTDTQSLQRQLTSLFWEINYLHFGGILPPLEVRFSNRLKTTGGQYFRKPTRMIHISTRYFHGDDPWKEILDTLGHEMVHYWLDFRGRPCGHNAEFRMKLGACGFNRYSRLSPLGARYVYLCFYCGETYYRRRHGTWSCGPCSGRRYNSKYRLVLAGQLPSS